MNVVSYLEKKSDKDIEFIRSFFYRNYIKTHVEDTITESKRMIFMTNKNHSDFSNPIVQECNGLIIEANENKYRALVVPILKFHSSYRKSDVNHLYKESLYALYKVIDGTTVNLYYYNGSWRISTANGYDVSNLNFINTKTYSDVLVELFNLYPNFTFDKLQTHKCYTLIFTYTEFHAFNVNNNSIVFVQSVDLNEFNNNKKLVISYDDDIGVPFQQELTTTKSLNDIYNETYHAYNNYLKTGVVNFGYILRSKNQSRTRQHNHILIESSLMSSIRKLMYNNSIYNDLIKSDFLKELNLNYNKMQINVLQAYLNVNTMAKFNKLFPQFSNEIKKINIVVKHIIPKYILLNKTVLHDNYLNIHKILNNEMLLNCRQLPDNNITDIHKFNKMIVLLYSDLVTANLNFDVFEIEFIISDFITNIKFISYYNLYFYN
jgi:hypothetical protein